MCFTYNYSIRLYFETICYLELLFIAPESAIRGHLDFGLRVCYSVTLSVSKKTLTLAIIF